MSSHYHFKSRCCSDFWEFCTVLNALSAVISASSAFYRVIDSALLLPLQPRPPISPFYSLYRMERQHAGALALPLIEGVV